MSAVGRVKVYCAETGKKWAPGGGTVHEATFRGGNSERFAAPNNELKLGGMEDQKFEVGKLYYIDVVPAAD